jgi:GTP-binding protein
MFIDRAEILVRGGRGGDGCVSFRRERFIPKGGPNGGDGGDGGSVHFLADPTINTLLDLKGRHHWIAGNGQPGKGKDMTGRSGKDLVVRVPPGTLIYDRDSDRLLKDLDAPHKRVCIARGGRGGKGNAHFATSRHQTPRFAQPGEEPEERWLRLELKLIADVGLVGLPNAGKSTLLSRLTKARPKIADYPFTTTEPQLGIVELPGYRRFVMADIPGLIEGAHEGAGLGDDFLRHIERTRVIVHLIDVHPIAAHPTPGEAYRIIRNELQSHSRKLADKPEAVVANKIDLSDSLEAVEALRDNLESDGIHRSEVLAISGVTGAGLQQLGKRLWEMIEEARQTRPSDSEDGLSDDPFRDVVAEETGRTVSTTPEGHPSENAPADSGAVTPQCPRREGSNGGVS